VPRLRRLLARCRRAGKDPRRDGRNGATERSAGGRPAPAYRVGPSLHLSDADGGTDVAAAHASSLQVARLPSLAVQRGKDAAEPARKMLDLHSALLSNCQTRGFQLNLLACRRTGTRRPLSSVHGKRRGRPTPRPDRSEAFLLSKTTNDHE